MERGIVQTVPNAPAVTIVTDGWPSALIAAQALRLSVRAAYFPHRLHGGFNPSNFRLLEWRKPRDFDYRDLHGTALIISGTLPFVRRYADRLTTVKSTVVHVFTPMEGVSTKAAKRALSQISKFMKEQDLQVESWHDARAGGCTDAFYEVGFRTQFWLEVVPSPNNVVERSLRHFLGPKVSPHEAPEVGAGSFEHLEGLPPKRRAMRGASV